MQAMNCLIIEDEPLAAKIIEDYINDTPGLHLAGVCDDVASATACLRQQTVDILFVDIHLPRINGIEFARMLKGNYHIIFTTAYHQYAVEGFEVNATDYLLKPIGYSRFLQAINRVSDKKQLPNISASSLETALQREFQFFNVDKKQVKIYWDDIIYIESLKDYVSIYLPERRIITKFGITELCRILPQHNFLRVHKSFVVNMDKITAFSAQGLDVGNTSIPVGRSYKEQVHTYLKSKPI